MTMCGRRDVLAGLGGILALGRGALAQPADTTRLIVPGYLAPRFVAPPDAPASIVIAARDEPGERLIVSGRVLDGTRPVAGASIYVVQADAKGRYSRQFPDSDLNARIFGFMRSDASGQYRYETIRPGQYGPATNPSHVHYVVNTPGYKPRMFDLRFADDPVIVARRQDGIPDDDGFAPGWMVVRPVNRDAKGVWHVSRDLEMIRD